MSIDSIARVVPMRGQFVVQRRGMYLTEIYTTEEDAQIVADRWNENILLSKRADDKKTISRHTGPAKGN